MLQCYSTSSLHHEESHSRVHNTNNNSHLLYLLLCYSNLQKSRVRSLVEHTTACTHRASCSFLRASHCDYVHHTCGTARPLSSSAASFQQLVQPEHSSSPATPHQSCKFHLYCPPVLLLLFPSFVSHSPPLLVCFCVPWSFCLLRFLSFLSCSDFHP